MPERRLRPTGAPRAAAAAVTAVTTVPGGIGVTFAPVDGLLDFLAEVVARERGTGTPLHFAVAVQAEAVTLTITGPPLPTLGRRPGREA